MSSALGFQIFRVSKTFRCPKPEHKPDNLQPKPCYQPQDLIRVRAFAGNTLAASGVPALFERRHPKFLLKQGTPNPTAWSGGLLHTG